MNQFVDEVLAGEPRFKITLNDNTILSNVKIELETEVTTQGTAMNKAYFDSIEADLNSRLLISNKASTFEAQAGTNNTKYITPKTNKEANQLFNSSGTASSTTAQTIFTFDNSKSNLIVIKGTFSGGNSYTKSMQVLLNGSGFVGMLWDEQGNHYGISTSSVDAGFSHSSNLLKMYSNSNTTAFEMLIDLATKTFKIEYSGSWIVSNTSQGINHTVVMGKFTSLDTLQIQAKDSSTGDWTIKGYQIG